MMYDCLKYWCQGILMIQERKAKQKKTKVRKTSSNHFYYSNEEKRKKKRKIFDFTQKRRQGEDKKERYSIC
jgi:hypothetical protein